MVSIGGMLTQSVSNVNNKYTITLKNNMLTVEVNSTKTLIPLSNVAWMSVEDDS